LRGLAPTRQVHFSCRGCLNRRELFLGDDGEEDDDNDIPGKWQVTQAGQP